MLSCGIAGRSARKLKRRAQGAEANDGRVAHPAQFQGKKRGVAALPSA